MDFNNNEKKQYHDKYDINNINTDNTNNIIDSNYLENNKYKNNDSNFPPSRNNPETEDDFIFEKSKQVDVRIIVEGPEISEFLSKAIKNIELGDNFNIVISSIITTNNVEIARNATIGSDIILIATNNDNEGKKLFSDFYREIKNDFNYVEILKFPKFRDIEITDIKDVENEIKNSIIKVVLSSISDIANINQVKAKLLSTDEKLLDSESESEKITLENEMLISEANQLREENNKLNKEISSLQSHIDEIKLDFTDFKSRFSNIHTRNLIEVFKLTDLWNEIFDEILEDSIIDKIVIATNKFKPENILVGQGLIGSISKDEAIDWLKIVKTALIFLEDSSEELQEELISYNTHNTINTHNINNTNKNNKNNNNDDNDDVNNPNHNDYANHNSYDNSDTRYNQNLNNEENRFESDFEDKSDNNIENYRNKTYKDKYSTNSQNKRKYNEDDEEDEDYDIPNQFQNFWD